MYLIQVFAGGVQPNLTFTDNGLELNEKEVWSWALLGSISLCFEEFLEYDKSRRNSQNKTMPQVRITRWFSIFGRYLEVPAMPDEVGSHEGNGVAGKTVCNIFSCSRIETSRHFATVELLTKTQKATSSPLGVVVSDSHTWTSSRVTQQRSTDLLVNAKRYRMPIHLQ